MNVFWFLPTHGDGRFLGTAEGARPVSLNYLKQVAQAADSLGYYGVLLPTDRRDDGIESVHIVEMFNPLADKWQAHPSRANQTITLVRGVEHMWTECEVPLNACVIRFWNTKKKRTDYIVLVTTDLELNAPLIVRHYEERPEIEQDYQICRERTKISVSRDPYRLVT